MHPNRTIQPHEAVIALNISIKLVLIVLSIDNKMKISAVHPTLFFMFRFVDLTKV